MSTSKTQSNTDMIKMQPSPAYVPMSQDTLNALTIPQYETVQDCSDVQMDANPAYLSHRNI